MATIHEFLDTSKVTNSIDRLAELLSDNNLALVSSMRRVDDQETIRIRQPGRAYPDGFEYFMGWGNPLSSLVEGEGNIGVFGLYVASQHLLFQYYVGGIEPTEQDIAEAQRTMQRYQ